MKITITHNLPEFQDAMKHGASQVPFATMKAINKVAESSRVNVRAEMTRVFDRPTPWVLNSLRIKYATKQNLTAELTFKEEHSITGGGRTMIEPHIIGGQRRTKAMEARLMRLGLLPGGWRVVPGEAAKLDAYGNLSPGQITTLLNVLGTYTEAGYNKADSRTVARLAKGSVKKNQYGFQYWVNPVGGRKGRHLQPGVYQRVKTGFGTSLKPVLIFVSQAKYKPRLDFHGIAAKTVDKEFAAQFSTAFEDAMRTAIPKTQGQLL